MEAKIIKTNGKEKLIKPANGTDFSLWELQEAVGGYVEFIHINESCTMVVDEEGCLKYKTVNQKASEMAHRVIAGDVLVCDKNMIK